MISIQIDMVLDIVVPLRSIVLIWPVFNIERVWDPSGVHVEKAKTNSLRGVV